MRKIINYKDTEIEFSVSAATPREYRKQFNDDLIVEFEKMQTKSIQAMAAVDVEDDAEMYLAELSCTNVELLENFAWVCAGCPDKKIETWLAKFDPDFITTIWADLYALWNGNNETIEHEESKNAVTEE